MKQFEENPTVSLEAVKFNVKDNAAHHETIKNISRKLEKMYGIKVDKNRTPLMLILWDKYYEDMKTDGGKMSSVRTFILFQRMV